MSRKKNNRIQRSGPYFAIYQDMFNSDAFRSLNCKERCLLLELFAFYQPSREDVFLSTRDAAKRLKIHRDTACKAFKTLEDRGFIRLTQGALWQARLTRTWRLTFMEYQGREPTDEWRDYKSKADPKRSDKVSESSGRSWLIDAVKADL